MSINRAVLLGNVGKDPEIRSANGDSNVATFSLATSETWKDKATGERKEETQWHTIVCFNQNIIPVIRDYVKKGSRGAVEGSIKTRKWTDKNGTDRWSTEIVIGRFDGRLSLEGQPSGSASREEHGYGSTRSKGTPDDPRTMQGAGDDNAARDRGARTARGEIIDDDIPF